MKVSLLMPVLEIPTRGCKSTCQNNMLQSSNAQHDIQNVLSCAVKFAAETMSASTFCFCTLLLNSTQAHLSMLNSIHTTARLQLHDAVHQANTRRGIEAHMHAAYQIAPQGLGGTGVVRDISIGMQAKHLRCLH